MILLRGLWLFYRKIIIPSIAFSIMLQMMRLIIEKPFSVKWVGIGYLLFAALFHLLIYEIKNKQEYYFYHNMGLSRLFLWKFTIITSILFMLLIMIGWLVYKQIAS